MTSEVSLGTEVAPATMAVEEGEEDLPALGLEMMTS